MNVFQVILGEAIFTRKDFLFFHSLFTEGKSAWLREQLADIKKKQENLQNNWKPNDNISSSHTAFLWLAVGGKIYNKQRWFAQVFSYSLT